MNGARLRIAVAQPLHVPLFRSAQALAWRRHGILGSFWEAYQRTGANPKILSSKMVAGCFSLKRSTTNSTAGIIHFPDNIKSAARYCAVSGTAVFSRITNSTANMSLLFTDSRFKQVFTFLERYNFTIAEDSPLDQEVAVDPE